jgi:hypothetical protein
LELALDLANPRLTPVDAVTGLPQAAPDGAVSGPTNVASIFAAGPKAALSTNQKTMAALALACDMELTPKAAHAALFSHHQKLVEQQDAAKYIKTVEDKISARRRAAR